VGLHGDVLVSMGLVNSKGANWYLPGVLVGFHWDVVASQAVPDSSASEE